VIDFKRFLDAIPNVNVCQHIDSTLQTIDFKRFLDAIGQVDYWQLAIGYETDYCNVRHCRSSPGLGCGLHRKCSLRVNLSRRTVIHGNLWAQLLNLKVQQMPAGRPSKYKPMYCRQARELCLLGATDKELATFFCVDEKTVNTWKIMHPQFLQSLKEGKDEADGRVRKSLFQRAIGYSHADVHISNFKGLIKITPIMKHYPPDPTSCIFWLKNRQPEQWRDQTNVKVEHEFTAKITQAQESLEEKLHAIDAERTSETSTRIN